MRNSITCFLLFITTAACTQSIVDSNDREIVFRGVNLIPMDTERVLENQTVVVKAGRVSGYGDKVKYSRKALVVDAKGKYLIPGLAEMHAHVPPVDDLEPMKDVLILFAAHGITTIRGMLGHPKHLELRSMINSGAVVGPTLYTTGPSFNGTTVKTPEEGARKVREQKQAGYDYLKLHPGLTRQNFDAVARTAKEVGIPFVGHVSFDVGVWRAIEAGYSSIDHLDGFIEGLVPLVRMLAEDQVGLFGIYVADRADEKLIPDLMKGLKSNNIWVVPTQSLAERWFNPDFSISEFKNDPQTKYLSPATFDNWVSSKEDFDNNPRNNADMLREYLVLRRKLIKACHDNGVGLLLGCDAPQILNVPGSSTHHELAYMVKAGLTPFQALQTGTVNVSRYLNRPDEGTIKVDAVADLVLLGGNPLLDINQTTKIEGVMLKGKWLSREYLDTALTQREKR
jgi:imidazolonepropionase-like amidohydrolase